MTNMKLDINLVRYDLLEQVMDKLTHKREMETRKQHSSEQSAKDCYRRNDPEQLMCEKSASYHRGTVAGIQEALDLLVILQPHKVLRLNLEDMIEA